MTPGLDTLPPVERVLLGRVRPDPAAVTIEEVRTDADLDAFLALPLRLHRDDPAFVAPVQAWLRRRLSSRNPFLAEAALRLFLARRGGEVVGTISALRDRKHEEVHGEAVAFFGFFCCEEDLEVAEALLGRVRQVARGWGAGVLRGPRNLSRIEEVGVTVEGFDTPPPFLAGHHPRHAQELLEALGLVKHHDVLAYDIDLYDTDPATGARRPLPLPPQLADKAAQVALPGLEIRGLQWRRWRQDIGVAHEVFVDAFRDVPDNTPMPREQFVGLGGGLLLVTNRQMLQIATVGGRAAGFALCFPEINEALAAAQGRLLPWGALRALAAFPRIRTASFKLLGVLPEHRGSGLHAALIAQAIEGVRAAGYERLEASLIDERNGPMRHIVEAAGMQVYRRYRVYEQAL